jgi:hypothetical protein
VATVVPICLAEPPEPPPLAMFPPGAGKCEFASLWCWCGCPPWQVVVEPTTGDAYARILPTPTLPVIVDTAPNQLAPVKCRSEVRIDVRSA